MFRRAGFCVWVGLVTLDRDRGDRGMVGCPVFMVEIGTLLADFLEFLYAIILSNARSSGLVASNWYSFS